MKPMNNWTTIAATVFTTSLVIRAEPATQAIVARWSPVNRHRWFWVLDWYRVTYQHTLEDSHDDEA